MTFFKLARRAVADERVAIMKFAAPCDVLHIATFLRFCAMWMCTVTPDLPDHGPWSRTRAQKCRFSTNCEAAYGLGATKAVQHQVDISS